MNSPSPSASAPSLPPLPRPPPPIHTSKSLWDPVGDPAKLRAAASAWTTLAAALRDTDQGLGDAVNTVAASWNGDAFTAFSTWETTLAGVFDRAADQADNTAAWLNTTADFIDQKNSEIHHLYEAIAATAAVGIGLSIITFGISDAAAAVSTAAMVSEAEGIVAAIGSFLADMATTVAGYAADFAAQWAKALTMVLTVDETVKTVEGQPLDWHLADLTSAVGYATAIAAVPGDFAAAHPFTAGAIVGGTGSTLDTVVSGAAFNLRSLEDIGIAALAGGTLNTALNQLFPAVSAPEDEPLPGAGAGSAAMFSSGSAMSNAEVVESGAGLSRTAETVSDVAARAGVNLEGSTVHIIEDPEYIRYLDSQGACACAPYDLPGEIHIGPASFLDEETLASTLAHEQAHVLQYAAGYVPGSGDLEAMEAAARAAEVPAVARLSEATP